MQAQATVPRGYAFAPAPIRTAFWVWATWTTLSILLSVGAATQGFAGESAASFAIGASLVGSLSAFLLFGLLFWTTFTGSNGARIAIVVLKSIGLVFALLVFLAFLGVSAVFGIGGLGPSWQPSAGLVSAAVNGVVIWGLTRPESRAWTAPALAVAPGSWQAAPPAAYAPPPYAATGPAPAPPQSPVPNRACPHCGRATPSNLLYCVACKAMLP